MPAGNTPTASATGSDIVVRWPAASFPDGTDVAGYIVQRYDASIGAAATVGANCGGTVTGTTCTEHNVPSGSWTYTDTPVQANWTGAPSPASNPVGVGTITAPTVTPPATTLGGGASSNLASPTLTVGGPSSGIVGTAISATAITATLSQSSGANSTGTIAFRVYGPAASAPSTCTTGGTSLGSATVSGDGAYSAGNEFTPSQPGSYWLYASYNGDTNNNGVTSACPPAEPIVVG
jgi:hypothetical protein